VATSNTLIISLGLLALVALVLGGIWLIKPQLFRIKAALFKWVLLDIEVRSPAVRPVLKQKVTSSDKAPSG
jgi:hypothetical protein